ncbi:MAG: carboxypeptidase-like regulatory domain-containing protein [Bacteroidales bacterium]
MKIIKFFSIMLAILLTGAMQVQAASTFPDDEDVLDTTNYIVYTGKVVDASNNSSLPFANIESEGMNIATVTNIDGNFTLKVPKNSSVNTFKVSYVGYKNSTQSLQKYRNLDYNIIRLDPTAVNLKEVTIRAEDAEDLIDEVLKNIPKNYSNEDMMMTAFYRETILKRRNYVSISEAVIDIYKTPYDNDFRYDQARLIQGRKSADVEKMDTILFKIQGGPVTTLLLDIVKNPYILLTDQYKKAYNFHITSVISINDRLHYVISFNQKPHVTVPLYKGKLFVDMDNLAITETEFELNMNDEMEVVRMFIRKKPIGMKVIPERAVYMVKYTIEDNLTWYFNYARAEVKFDVKWDKKLFKTSYVAMSEIAITDRNDKPAERFRYRERFKRSQVLEELVYVFFDQDFWGGYNIIEPDQSIESAIRKLNRKFLRSDRADDTNP